MKRLFKIIILCSIMFTGIFPINIHAQFSGEQQKDNKQEINWESPYYVGTDVQPAKRTIGPQPHLYASIPDISSIDVAANYLYSQLKNCETYVTIRYHGDFNDFEEIVRTSFYRASGFENVAIKKDDYVKYNIHSYYAEGSMYDYDSFYITFTFDYLASKFENAQVNQKASLILKSLNLSKDSDYIKTKKIYDYITETVTYDNTFTKYSAYNALIEGNSVCQGYSLAMYKLLEQSNVNTRIISSKKMDHAWNIVSLGGKYYGIDATWDAGRYPDYDYFLKVGSAFNHTPDPEFLTNQFLNNFPMASTSYRIVDGIKITPSNVTVSVGKSFKASAVITPSTATNKKVTWSSGNTKIITVDANGNVKAVGAGTTYLYAKSAEGTQSKVLIKVIQMPKTITLNPSSATVSTGASFKIKPILTPSNAYNKVTYRSGNTRVATVDANGTVKALLPGQIYIYATTANGIESKMVLKVVQAPTKITLNPTSATISVGKSFKATAVVTPSNAANKSVTYSSGNTKIITVDAAGNVKAVGPGTTYLYAKTSNGIVIKSLIKVISYPTKITANPSKATISVGKGFQAKAIIAPTNATTSISYESSNPKVFTVDKNGYVKAVGSGSATLTIKTSNGLKATSIITVVK